jgi:hypothetical protein
MYNNNLFSAPAIKLASCLKFSPALQGDYGGEQALEDFFSSLLVAQSTLFSYSVLRSSW